MRVSGRRRGMGPLGYLHLLRHDGLAKLLEVFGWNLDGGQRRRSDGKYSRKEI